MSALTLETLWADFEAARLVVDHLPRPTVACIKDPSYHRYEWMEDADRCAKSFGGQTPDWLDDSDNGAPIKRTLLAARLYVIACDIGEFNPMKALMLWKIQNGGV